MPTDPRPTRSPTVRCSVLATEGLPSRQCPINPWAVHLAHPLGPEPEACPLVSQGIDRVVSQKTLKNTSFPAFPRGRQIVSRGQSQGQPWRKVGGKPTR